MIYEMKEKMIVRLNESSTEKKSLRLLFSLDVNERNYAWPLKNRGRGG